VDPVTGEGIGWAVRSGALAGAAAADALGAGRPEAALAGYRRALRPVLAELARANLLRRLIYPRPLRDRALALLAASPRLQRRYLGLLAGEIDYADVRLAQLAAIALRILLTGRGARA
jgi:flavin-dependent dehydrogenase